MTPSFSTAQERDAYMLQKAIMDMAESLREMLTVQRSMLEVLQKQQEMIGMLKQTVTVEAMDTKSSTDVLKTSTKSRGSK